MSTTAVAVPKTPLKKAIETLEALLNSRDEQVRLEAAKAILGRYA